MKLLKILGLIFAVLAAIAMGFAALLPNSYVVERSILVNTPPEVVFELVTDFSQYKKWNVWALEAKNAKLSIKGIPMQVGHTWSWESEQMGKGSFSIKKADFGKSMEGELKFSAPMDIVAQDVWQFVPEGNGTRVIWTNTGSCPFPTMRFFGLFAEGLLGHDFDKSLVALKSLAENS